MKYLTEKDKAFWTYEEYYTGTQEGYWFEFIEGIPFKPLPQTFAHASVKSHLLYAFSMFIRNNKSGEVLFGMDVVLNDTNVVNPDLWFVKEERRRIIQDRAVFGAPDLIVEIISPSSYYRDQVEKKDLYEQFGVKEYWIIDPANQVIQIFTLQENKYVLHAFVAEEGKVTSALLNGFEVSISEIINQ